MSRRPPRLSKIPQPDTRISSSFLGRGTTGSSPILPRSFYVRNTKTVARELLGHTLVHVCNGRRLSGRIVETEAYIGVGDKACHAFGGRRTRRTETMYLSGGTAYVYLIYGLHSCLNVVTREAEEPEAVLIRALQPLEGVAQMRTRRDVRNECDLANGPGKLCAALGIDRSFDKLALSHPPLFIEEGIRVPSSAVVSSPRIGIDFAGEAASWNLRFSIRDNPCVSKPWPWRKQ